MFRFKKYFEANSTLIIAEFANAFEGKKDIALKMIDKAVEAGVDALKFQVFFTDELLVPEHPKYDVFKHLETSRDDWYDILNYAAGAGKLIFIDIYGEESFQFSQDFKADAYKIPPSEMTNAPLIDQVSLSGISLIFSAGAATLPEIENAITISGKNRSEDFVLMHGFQAYPTKLEDTNLNYLATLKRQFHCPVGYADHVDGGSELALLIPLLAVAKGAKLIEKHFTLNRELKGTDYQSAVNPDILKKLVQYIRDVDIIFSKSRKELSTDERVYKEDVRKRIIARRRLAAGEKIDKQDVTFKRAPEGVFAEELGKITGRTVVKEIGENQVLKWEYMD